MIDTGDVKNLGLDKSDSIHSALLTAIARSAEDLTNETDYISGINRLLKNLGEITKVSRVWIFQTLKYTDEFVLQDYVYEWTPHSKYDQVNLPAFNKFITYIDEPDYKKMVQSRMRGEYQMMIVSELSPSFNKRNLESQGVKSMLTIPIFVENRWWGTLGFDDCEREYRWSDSEIAALRTSAFLISNALLRANLSAKRRQLDILQQITIYSAWELDIERNYLWFSSEVFESQEEKHSKLQFTFSQMLKIVHKNDRKRLLKETREYLNNKNEYFRCDIRIFTEKNRYRWIELIGNTDNTAHTENSKLIGIAIDITKRKEEEEKLKKEASTDALTGISNRRVFDHIIQKQFTLHKESKDVFTLLLIDIDFFKTINDTYGHQIGDKILIHIVNICKNDMRKQDTLARIGGEEFAILLPKTRLYEAKKIAQRIREKVENNPFILEGNSIPCTISIGISTSHRVKKLHNIFSLADLALYKAKREGRNRVCVD